MSTTTQFIDLVPCHYCKAPAGQPCQKRTGGETLTHKARSEDAQDYLRSAPSPHAHLFLPQYQNTRILGKQSHYLIDGVRYRRVSTILGVIHKHLGPWYRNMALGEVKAILDDPETVEALNVLFDTRPLPEEAAPEQWLNWQQDYDGFVSRLLDAAKAAPEKVRDEKAEFGTNVHAELAEWLQDPLPFSCYSVQFQAARQFLDDYGITLDATEVILWDDLNQVAGTGDWVGRNRIGKRVIGDWKTGSGPWPEMALQLGAYGHMLTDLTGEGPWVGYIVKLPGADSESETYEAHTLSSPTTASHAFRNAHALKIDTERKWWI